jgi:hypothetical protein
MTFECFYKAYPVKRSRVSAQRAWKKLNEADRKRALDTLSAHVRFWDVAGVEKQFIPYPATWLNQRRWEDDLEMPEPKVATAWWTSEEATNAMADNLGLRAQGGEGWSDFRQRIAAKLRAA